MYFVDVSHIMLLNDLLKPRIIQLRKLRQIMHVSNDITQILLQ